MGSWAPRVGSLSFQEASLACDVICDKTGSPAHGTKSDLSPEGFNLGVRVLV